MNLSAPTIPVFLISLILAILAIVGFSGTVIPYVTDNAFWVAIAAYVVLMVGNLLRGL